ncbi:hypothetical protein AAHW59_20195 [Klebsiella pneumoniae]|nr:hypothetical protein [Klebsiella pneumoniae]
MKEELLLLRNQLKMGHRISFAEAMLLQRAIDILVNKAGNSPAQSDCCQAQGTDRPVAWHHTAKCKDENHSTCCFSYSPTHDFGPWYEKPQSQPHYLPESLDYDRALHFLSTEPRKVTPETLSVGNSPVIPDGSEQRISEAVELLKLAAPAMLADDSVPNGPLVGRMKIPDGYVMVPKEPTKQMILAGQEELESCIDNGFDSDIDGNRYDYTDIVPDAPHRVFMAMLAAAPQEVKP